MEVSELQPQLYLDGLANLEKKYGKPGATSAASTAYRVAQLQRVIDDLERKRSKPPASSPSTGASVVGAENVEEWIKQGLVERAKLQKKVAAKVRDTLKRKAAAGSGA